MCEATGNIYAGSVVSDDCGPPWTFVVGSIFLKGDGMAHKIWDEVGGMK